MAQQDSNQTQQQNPAEGMAEEAKEPQGVGVTATPGDPDQQGNTKLHAKPYSGNRNVFSSIIYSDDRVSVATR